MCIREDDELHERSIELRLLQSEAAPDEKHYRLLLKYLQMVMIRIFKDRVGAACSLSSNSRDPEVAVSQWWYHLTPCSLGL
ncbi:MAG: hypothetical protein AB8B79_21510 [Granulosicoccus sp.]